MSLRDDLLRLFPDLRKIPAGEYVVGGAVRDLLRGVKPADVDVASNDPLAAARTLGRKVIQLGKAEHISAFRVVTGEHVYDFAELLDHDLDADLARRDFTINAMAVSLDTGDLFDPHRGQRDLDGRIVRMIDASNFDDDPLRMLKSIRMAVKFDFAIDDATLAAIRPRAARINDVAEERVEFELSEIFSARKFRTAVALLRSTALDVPLFGRELTPSHRDDLSYAAAMAVIADKPRERWSHSFVREVNTLKQLMKQHDLIALYDAGESIARQLPALLDEEVTMPDFTIKPLLNGDEIAKLTGIEAGPRLGEVKRALLEAQIRGEVATKAEAEEYVRRGGRPRPPGAA